MTKNTRELNPGPGPEELIKLQLLTIIAAETTIPTLLLLTSNDLKMEQASIFWPLLLETFS